MTPRKSTAASSTMPLVRTFKASGAVEKVEDRPWTERGITISVITLGQHHPGATEIPVVTVRVENKELIPNLEKGDRIAVSGELGKLERGWNQPAVVQVVERFEPGAPMELVNEVEVIGKRLSASPTTLHESTLYDLQLELADGSRVLVKVYKNRREQLEGTEDGQVLQIRGTLNMFEYQGQDVTQVKATSIKVAE